MSSPNLWGKGTPSAIRPVRSELVSPEVKATAGMTYFNFSFMLDEFIKSELDTATRNKYLMDALYGSVRLREWQPIKTDHDSDAYEIWNRSESVRVLVSQRSVVVIKGIRVYQLVVDLAATSLFSAIKHAQELIRTNVTVDNSADEEFFKEAPEGEEIDLSKVFDDKKDDSTPDEYLDTKPSPEKLEPADVKQSRPTMEQEQLLRRLKSLQGRVLTIVEASLSDKAQREAVKTLMNKEFRREIDKAITFFELPGEGHTSNEDEE